MSLGGLKGFVRIAANQVVAGRNVEYKANNTHNIVRSDRLEMSLRKCIDNQKDDLTFKPDLGNKENINQLALNVAAKLIKNSDCATKDQKVKDLATVSIQVTHNTGSHPSADAKDMTNLLSFYLVSNQDNASEVLKILSADLNMYNQDSHNIMDCRNPQGVRVTTHCLSHKCTQVVDSMLDFIDTSIDVLGQAKRASGGGGPVDSRKLRQYIFKLSNSSMFGSKVSDASGLNFLKEIVETNSDLKRKLTFVLGKCKDNIEVIKKNYADPSLDAPIQKLLDIVTPGNPLLGHSDPDHRSSPASVHELPVTPPLNSETPVGRTGAAAEEPS